MEPEEYARIAAAEDDHWWYRSTRAISAELLSPWLRSGQTLLDAGCGPGGNGAWLSAHGTVVGTDLALEGLQFVRQRRTEMAPVQASLTALPFADASFDVVMEVTVLYSVDDDAAAVEELARVVKPGGVLLMLEPAFEALRRAHDKTVHTVRRYRRASLSVLAQRAGLELDRSTYLYSFLAPPAAALGLVDRVFDRDVKGTGSDVEKRALDRVFGPLAAVERRRLRRGAIPFGSSVAVVATRP
jgi:ubiquinone/menaquinone biosynthesis C-methylase UbiE